VMRAAKTTRESAQCTLQQLAVDRINVLGTVLNDWDPKRSTRYGYHRDYTHHYRDYYSRLSR
jgi:Mrp family chromosome partitioning ATPase